MWAKRSYYIRRGVPTSWVVHTKFTGPLIIILLNDAIGLPEILSMVYPYSAFTLTGDAGR